MKRAMMFPLVVLVMLASACVAEDADGPELGDAESSAVRGADEGVRAMGEETEVVFGSEGTTSVGAATPSQTGGAGGEQETPTEPVLVEDKAEPEGPLGGQGLVDDHDFSIEGRCSPALSILDDARAFQISDAIIDVEIRGQLFAQTPGEFTFAIFGEDGAQMYSRDWPEVESVEVREDGTFTMRARAVSCGTYIGAARIAVQLVDWSTEDHSNTLEMDIEAPTQAPLGASCEALGTACGEGAWCNQERVCEAW